MDQILALLRAAGEPTRLRILVLCAQGDLTVSELTQILGQSQPSISRHLKLLCDAGLLERLQEGSWAFFHLASGTIVAEVLSVLLDAIDPSDTELIRDAQRLAGIKATRAQRAEVYFRNAAASWNEIRALHVDEALVEAAIEDILSVDAHAALLDIGTGTGRMLQLLSHRVQHAVGIDKSRDMLAVARTNLSEPQYRNCNVRQADMYQLPFNDRSFDLIVLHMVLHFADEPANAIREAARVVSPGGHIVIIDFAPHEVEELRETHAHRRLGFRADEVEGWAGAHGLQTTDVRSLPGTSLNVTIWKTRRPAEVLRIDTSAGSHASV
ncbi:MAG TPA: ArsR family transcriptional regulator [Rhodospirillaceae bacterium]|nr:ArsR family transcriptional regulator [Rhodospirillaceae bacterium]